MLVSAKRGKRKLRKRRTNCRAIAATVHRRGAMALSLQETKSSDVVNLSLSGFYVCMVADLSPPPMLCQVEFVMYRNLGYPKKGVQQCSWDV